MSANGWMDKENEVYSQYNINYPHLCPVRKLNKFLSSPEEMPVISCISLSLWDLRRRGRCCCVWEEILAPEGIGWCEHDKNIYKILQELLQEWKTNCWVGCHFRLMHLDGKLCNQYSVIFLSWLWCWSNLSLHPSSAYETNCRVPIPRD